MRVYMTSSLQTHGNIRCIAMKRKILLLICDGLGDRPVPEFGGRTPLQEARKPAIDRMASRALHGLIYTISPGIVPGSDTSHLSLLGYNPGEVYTGRGPFEAKGAGMELRPGDIAFRCNFATVQNGIVTDRRAGRIREPDTGKLAGLISKMDIGDCSVEFRESTEHRAVLVLHGSGLGDRVSDTDPGETGKAILKATGADGRSQKTADVLNAFTEKALKVLGASDINRERAAKGLAPANAVLARGCGASPNVESFEKHHGLSFGAIAAEGLIKGICSYMGGKVVTPPGATAGMDTDLRAKGRAVREMLEEKDFVFVHVKPTDVAGHDGNFRGKVDIIEKVDSMIEDLNDIMGEVIFAMTADHSTPVTAREHTCDPVPLMINMEGGRSDGIGTFNEIDAARGSLTGLTGRDLMPLLKGYADRTEKYGA